ncbi:MAG TPA: preprotein translocase subunit SecA [Caldithrix abyssi]|uniref:Protein translocase subunit SecA n=1 Tax=Caldithrix abyssi TaxID=187145 RepID=A0A7V5VEB7_CALAY|nr:preprotein translocase subunit SecA [Caldithrix abyssi]
MIQSVFKKVFGSKNDREVKRLSLIVDEINAYYEEFQSLSEEQLKAKTDEFRQRLQEGETTDDILPEAFAVVKDACRRLKGVSWNVAGRDMVWDMIPFDVQLVGGIVLHQGKIAEMATGEGKTLVATLPLYLNALEGKGAHLVTVNDYLAQRDSEWMGHVLEYLGLTVGVILNDMTPEQRREAYNCDVTYGTNNEFGFDYLRDNMAGSVDNIVQVRGHHYSIVDEVDSVLIDEARTPLIISGPVSVSTHRYGEMKPLVERLVAAQNRLVNRLVKEGEDLIKAGKEREGANKLLMAEKGAPKNKRLLKLYHDPSIKRMVQGMENDYLRDKGQSKASDEHYFGELYFIVDEKSHTIDLTEKGRMEMNPSDPEMFLIPDLGEEIAKIEQDENLSEEQKLARKDELHQLLNERSEKVQNISQLLRAYTLYEKDQEYVVQDGKVQIVDEFTGRILSGRRYSDGLHQAIEAKENVKIERETQTLATITLQNFFRMYDKLAGMTGTAETEAAEFWEIYKLDVLVIPTNKPIARVDMDDRLYRTKREKYNAIIDEIELMNKLGRPVLVGTVTVEVSETLSRMLKRRGIKHNVLNAKQHKREAEIVSQAGERGAVTIATNMAGRGTDIKLGQGVLEAGDPEQGIPGGLHVIGTERHESRRIDRQLRGRSGRQGDPGSSIFYLSLEDDLMRLFATERVAGIMERLGAEEGEVITHKMMTKAIERAQRKVEARNFSIRKRLLDYDDVMNQQRTVIYDRRRAALMQEDTYAEVVNILDEYLDSTMAKFVDPRGHSEEWDLEGLKTEIQRIAFINIDKIYENVAAYTAEDLREKIKEAMLELYGLKEKRIGREKMAVLERYFILRVIDEEWKDHLYQMDMLKEGIHLQAYGQKDPLIEYKKEAYYMFTALIDRINVTILNWLWKFQLAEEPANREERRHVPMKTVHEASTNMGFDGVQAPESDIQKASRERSDKRQPIRVEKKPKPNEPCYCGSGKKYKKCHGANA